MMPSHSTPTHDGITSSPCEAPDPREELPANQGANTGTAPRDELLLTQQSVEAVEVMIISRKERLQRLSAVLQDGQTRLRQLESTRVRHSQAHVASTQQPRRSASVEPSFPLSGTSSSFQRKGDADETMEKVANGEIEESGPSIEVSALPSRSAVSAPPPFPSLPQLSSEVDTIDSHTIRERLRHHRALETRYAAVLAKTEEAAREEQCLVALLRQLRERSSSSFMALASTPASGDGSGWGQAMASLEEAAAADRQAVERMETYERLFMAGQEISRWQAREAHRTLFREHSQLQSQRAWQRAARQHGLARWQRLQHEAALELAATQRQCHDARLQVAALEKESSRQLRRLRRDIDKWQRREAAQLQRSPLLLYTDESRSTTARTQRQEEEPKAHAMVVEHCLAVSRLLRHTTLLALNQLQKSEHTLASTTTVVCGGGGGDGDTRRSHLQPAPLFLWQELSLMLQANVEHTARVRDVQRAQCRAAEDQADLIRQSLLTSYAELREALMNTPTL